MAQSYSLEMESDAGEEYVRALVLAHGGFTRDGDVLHHAGVSVFVKRPDPAEPGNAYTRQIMIEDFGIAPDIGMTFRIAAFEHVDEGMRLSVSLAVSLSGALSDEARLTYFSDYVVFVRRGGALVLDQTWAEGSPWLVAEIAEPYTVEDLRAQDEQRAAEATRRAAGETQ